MGEPVGQAPPARTPAENETMTILVVPSGTLGYPISEGTASFDPYPENPSDPRSRWLVDVPAAMAQRLVHNGGFQLMEQQPVMVPGMVRLRHPEGSGCSFGGVSYAADQDGSVLVPAGAAAHLAHHGFRGIDDAPVADPRLDDLQRQLAAKDAEIARLRGAAQGREGGDNKPPADPRGTPHPDVPARAASRK